MIVVSKAMGPLENHSCKMGITNQQSNNKTSSNRFGTLVDLVDDDNNVYTLIAQLANKNEE